MRVIRVYVDTSVFGGTDDIEFAEASRRFFEHISSTTSASRSSIA